MASSDESRLQRAAEMGAKGRWAEAAALFEEIARDATRRGQRDLARRAWTGAGDALRRDDRPAHAARALKAAEDLAVRGEPGRLMARATLAAVLVDAGEPVPAEILLRELLPEASEPGARVVVLDMLLGILLLLGRTDDAEGPYAELAALVGGLGPAAELARATLAFRTATRHRLRGELDAADRVLLAVGDTMETRRETVGAAAVALGERGEVALAAGDGAAAWIFFDHAAKLWTATGRRAGLYRAEAGLVRAALARGETPLATRLNSPIDYAKERGMVLLEAELRLARGAARANAHVSGGEEDLDLAVAICERASADLLEGRARLIRRRCGFLRNDTERTRHCLRGDRVWLAQLELAPGVKVW